MTPKATVFTRMPSLAYSIASGGRDRMQTALGHTWTATVRLRSAWSTRAVDTLTMAAALLLQHPLTLTVNVEKASKRRRDQSV